MAEHSLSTIINIGFCPRKLDLLEFIFWLGLDQGAETTAAFLTLPLTLSSQFALSLAPTRGFVASWRGLQKTPGEKIHSGRAETSAADGPAVPAVAKPGKVTRRWFFSSTQGMWVPG